MLVRPTMIVSDITTIIPQQLSALGIKGIIFDLDNTLMAPHTGKITPEMTQWLQHLRDAGLKLICVTNNKKQAYCVAAEAEIQMQVLFHAKKPDTKILQEAANIMAFPPEHIAIFGDRPLTDIMGGHRLGAKTILVDPLTKLTEPGYIKFLRKLERLCVKTI